MAAAAALPGRPHFPTMDHTEAGLSNGYPPRDLDLTASRSPLGALASMSQPTKDKRPIAASSDSPTGPGYRRPLRVSSSSRGSSLKASEPAPSAAASSASTTSAHSEGGKTISPITPSQSASQVESKRSRKESRTSFGRRVQNSAAADDVQLRKSIAKRASSSSRDLLSFRNLELASLSTPELHLASDPMVDTEEPAFHRRKDGDLASPRNGMLPSGAWDPAHSRTRSSEPASAHPNFTSIDAVMGTAENGASSKVPKDKKRNSAAATKPSSQSSDVASTAAQTSDAGGGANSVGSAATAAAGGSPSKNGFHPGTWFRRQRRWSANGRATQLTVDCGATATDNESDLSSQTVTSSATAGTGTTFFTQSAVADSTAAKSEMSLGIDASRTPEAAREDMRSARTFLISELGHAGRDDMGADAERIASLAWFTRVEEAETRGVTLENSRELFEFWTSISDGVLLCLLVNKLRPGCIDRIDRRDVEWVKADNISRFLRAARDHLGLRSRDLFQTLDLTDATEEGVQRVVHTILAVQRAAQSEPPSRPGTLIYDRRSWSTVSTSSPLTPSASHDSEDAAKASSEIPFPEARPSPSSSPRRRDSARLSMPPPSVQARKDVERALVASVQPGPLVEDASVRARRRRTYDGAGSILPASKTKGTSITFADSVRSGGSSDEENRMPYRDRKLSESAVSLTGVAEEEPEEVLLSVSTPMRSRSPSSPSAAFPDRFEEIERSESPLTTGGGSPMSRIPSQRRISAELGLGQAPRRSAAEMLEDYSFPSNGSLVRQSPVRRPSARSHAGPSALNPNRDSLLSIRSTSPDPGSPLTSQGSAFPATSLVPPRVPFPRSPSSPTAGDSSDAKRIGRHLSLTAGSGPASNASSASLVPASPKLGARPGFRHMRYSSELHLPLSGSYLQTKGSETSGDERSSFGFPRLRQDSEVGSLYTNTLGSLTNEEGASAVSRTSREPSVNPTSKHKLVVVEEGKPNVTYVSFR